MEAPYCKLGHHISRSFRPAVYLITMACIWAMVSAQDAAPPTTPPPSNRCSRELVTTVWGFILTLVALTLDDWGMWKNQEVNAFWNVFFLILFGTLNPLQALSMRLDNVMDSWEMRKRMSASKARSYIKILSGCKVVINLSHPTTYVQKENLTRLDAFELMQVQDFSDALVIGGVTMEEAEVRLQLSTVGKEALVKADILPPVDQLKILQGYSGLAVATSAIQGMGYIYGILVRVVQGLQVSPIEVIGFFLSTVILVKGIWHCYSSNCHRPLLLYFDADKEMKFINMCKAPEAVLSEWVFSLNYRVWKFVISYSVGAMLLGGPLVFFIIWIAKSTSLTMSNPLIMVGSTIFPFLGFAFVENMKKRTSKYSGIAETIDGDILPYAIFIVPSINFVAYISGLQLTVNNWKSLGFDVNIFGYLSELLPYIG